MMLLFLVFLFSFFVVHVYPLVLQAVEHALQNLYYFRYFSQKVLEIW